MDHYFITYDSKTGEMSGHFVSSTKDITPRPRFPGEAVLEVTSKEHIEKLASITPRSSRVMGRVEGGRLKALEVGPIFAGRIALVCDRPDMDGDGMAELPADGETVARITAKLLDREGKGVAREGLKIKFHVTRGSLSAREVQAKKGTAEVELRASAETVQARVVAQAEGFERGTLVLEFIPPEEHRKLAAASGKKARK